MDSHGESPTIEGLNEEPVLDPDLKICDAHHHLWDRPGGRYVTEDYVRDAQSGHRIVSSVYVDCVSMYRTTGPEHLRCVGETEFALGVATLCAARGLPRVCAGIVGFADLTVGRDVAEVLDAHLAITPRFKGIRYCTAWDANPSIHNAHTQPCEGLLEDSRFRQGFSTLQCRNLTFDAWVFHPQISNVQSLAQAFPETTIVLDHLGGPLGIGPYAGRRTEILAQWTASMRALSTCQNVVVKLGGIQMPLNGWRFHHETQPVNSARLVETIRDYYLRTIDFFGVHRCLFESNYPADKPSASFRVLWNAFKRITAEFSPDERASLFHDNAVRVYRLDSSA